MPTFTPETRRAVAKAINEGLTLADTRTVPMNETKIARKERRLPRAWHQGGLRADEAAIGQLLDESVVEFIVTKARELGGLPTSLHETLTEEFRAAYPTYPDGALWARAGSIIFEAKACLFRLAEEDPLTTYRQRADRMSNVVAKVSEPITKRVETSMPINQLTKAASASSSIKLKTLSPPAN